MDGPGPIRTADLTLIRPVVARCVGAKYRQTRHSEASGRSMAPGSAHWRSRARHCFWHCFLALFSVRQEPTQSAPNSHSEALAYQRWFRGIDVQSFHPFRVPEGVGRT